MRVGSELAAPFAGLALRDRAATFLAEHGSASQTDLLAHVYGGPIPPALHAKLAMPLLADPRFERHADDTWALRQRNQASRAFTALALVATGPTPARARLVRLCALSVSGSQILERFDVLLNPQKRVPRYVLARARIEPEILNEQPGFDAVVDDLERFLADRPVLAQDAHLTWSFVAAEARRMERQLPEPALLDLNELAMRQLELKRKPTLGGVAAQLGVAAGNLDHPDEEARILALVGGRLLTVRDVVVQEAHDRMSPLRRGATARDLPDEPGVYVLRDEEQNAVYVGKSRRLRQRMQAYVHRPLGATRRLEGLVGAVRDVDSTPCATELEALVLEDREIRRLMPRFNTVRRQRAPRYWLRLPPARANKALPRIELSFPPTSADAGDFIGPFRNEAAAQQARQLARDVFELDELRARGSAQYLERLPQAWSFLQGVSETAESLARSRSVALLRRVLHFDVSALLLAADPAECRYAVIRPGAGGVEGLVIDRGRLVSSATVGDEADVYSFAQRLLSPAEPRTGAEDTDVVLRWFGAQRPPARLIPLADERLEAADVIESGALGLLDAARGEA